MAEMLRIEDVYKTFNAGTINEKKALCGVNLTLEEGEFVTVIGGNGAGKSTTLNAQRRGYGVHEHKRLPPRCPPRRDRRIRRER